MATMVADVGEIVADLLDHPELVDGFLGGCSPDATFDANDPCGCVLHGFLASHGFDAEVCFDLIQDIDGEWYVHTADWVEDYQRALLAAREDSGDHSPCVVSAAQARDVLRPYLSSRALPGVPWWEEGVSHGTS